MNYTTKRQRLLAIVDLYRSVHKETATNMDDVAAWAIKLRLWPVPKRGDPVAICKAWESLLEHVRQDRMTTKEPNVASELKPHTPLPWVASVDFVCKESDVPGAKATPVADFQWADDAHYATKAVNMHERLVEKLREFGPQHGYPFCESCHINCEEQQDGSFKHRADCELAALLREAADE